MEPLAALVGVCALALVAGVALVAAYVSRQRTLSRRVGSFACGLRLRAGHAAVAGVAHYTADRLRWWRSLSLWPRPACAWVRADLVVVQRTPAGEVDEAGRALLRVTCEHRGEAFELVMSEQACAGLVSWLEAGPRAVRRVV